MNALGLETKTAFYRNIISKGIADTIGTIKNRQDLFDPFLTISNKAGRREAMPICIEKHSLTHYL